MVPPEGAPGSTVAAPSQPQAETIPTNPQTIVATGSINTLDQIITSNWIYDSTFTVSTSQAPGTIVYYKKIHPRGWNWTTDHVAKMFNCWTGAGSTRYRPVATVWYGGSIRVGYLPPSVLESQLQTIPLEVLTTFPNRDIDPKNTGWVEFTPPDERNIMYHYMDDKDRQGFGGWIVFYVAARLVTQSPEYTTIQMIVENKGGFMFDQVSPFAISRVDQGPNPLSILSTIPLHKQCTSDAPQQVRAIQIEASTTTVITFPGFFHSAFGVFRATQEDAPSIPSINKSPVLVSDYSTETASFDGGQCFIGVTIDSTGELKDTKSGYLEYELNTISARFSTDDEKKKHEFFRGTVLRADQGGLSLNPLDLTGRKLWSGNSELPPPKITRIRNESIVLFVDNQITGTYSTQTNLISQILGAGIELDKNTTYLCQLISPAGTPLNYLRFWPDGLITTNATAARLLIPVYPTTGTNDGYTIRYLNTLPINDPIPAVPSTFFAIKPMLAKLAIKKDENIANDLASY